MLWVRADGNGKTGMGHLMRCLTIAGAYAELTGQRKSVKFICADNASAEFVEKKGFTALSLNSDYRDMESEIPKLLKIIDGKTSDAGILVDSYFVTKNYLENLGRAAKVFVMDDMMTECYPADAVINYNAFARRDIYEKIYSGTNTELFIGSDYIPIRKQFLTQGYNVRENCENILITTGGGDTENIAGAVLERAMPQDDRFIFHIVMGRFNPNFDKMCKLSEEKQNIKIYHDVENMASLMGMCDVAITAGGSTVYELSAVGVPFICFSYAKNQELLTEYIGKSDIACYAGKYHEDADRTLENIEAQFNTICGDVNLRKAFSEKERRLVDGEGAKRLASALKTQAFGWNFKAAARMEI